MSDFEWPDPEPAGYVAPGALHPLRPCLPVSGLNVLAAGDRCPTCDDEVPLQTVDGFKLDSCRSCHAPIVWATTDDGKSMPVDGPVDPDGNVTLSIRDGKVRAVVLDQAGLFDDGVRHVSHFATCPDAEAWRSRRVGQR